MVVLAGSLHTSGISRPTRFRLSRQFHVSGVRGHSINSRPNGNVPSIFSRSMQAYPRPQKVGSRGSSHARNTCPGLASQLLITGMPRGLPFATASLPPRGVQSRGVYLQLHLWSREGRTLRYNRTRHNTNVVGRRPCSGIVHSADIRALPDYVHRFPTLDVSSAALPALIVKGLQRNIKYSIQIYLYKYVRRLFRAPGDCRRIQSATAMASLSSQRRVHTRAPRRMEQVGGVLMLHHPCKAQAQISPMFPWLTTSGLGSDGRLRFEASSIASVQPDPHGLRATRPFMEGLRTS